MASKVRKDFFKNFKKGQKWPKTRTQGSNFQLQLESTSQTPPKQGKTGKTSNYYHLRLPVKCQKQGYGKVPFQKTN